MLTNGSSSGPACAAWGPHRGRIHEYTSQMIAKLDGTPVKDAPEKLMYLCEGCYPDPEDPKFVLCACGLCKKTARSN